ncbi:hypothetical protein RRG08_046150 [Elysia crispata]|uniref:Uncharacterized protein n=1 Tax=Elysia crispata TaxID=231223 RepID=A0AAE0XNL7_9GAST|nr:hypothetical protein RRG08_052498 [Elysia crispata]KAK3782122.1 hypothetical protein RRG08_046150 [Elysia crispata]
MNKRKHKRGQEEDEKEERLGEQEIDEKEQRHRRQENDEKEERLREQEKDTRCDPEELGLREYDVPGQQESLRHETETASEEDGDTELHLSGDSGRIRSASI